MKKKFVFIVLGILLMLAVIISLAVGAVYIPLNQVVYSIGRWLHLYNGEGIDEQYAGIMEIVRIPRVLLGLLVGAALGVCGAAIQAVFRNPLAEPGLIGISAGASLSSAVIITIEVTLLSGLSEWLGTYLLAIGAFAGAILAAMAVYGIAMTNGRPNIATMLLAGIAINALAGALTGLLSFVADDQQLRTITFWMLGSLGGASEEVLLAIAPFILLPVLLLPFQGKKLNAFMLGEAQAGQLGVNTSLLKKKVVLLVTIAVGASVAVAGIIGFVGLLVPHLVRLWGGVDNRFVLPASALAGALILTVADTLSRVIMPPSELPIGVITALLGTPVFLYMLVKDKKKLLQ